MQAGLVLVPHSVSKNTAEPKVAEPATSYLHLIESTCSGKFKKARKTSVLRALNTI
jgi:hypothetical protein